MRCDQSSATGFAPSQLLLGRNLVYPIELNPSDVDLTGTKMTAPLVLKLRDIHDENFGIAHKSIQKNQQRYKRKYDRQHNTKKFNFKVGDRVQYKRHKSQKVLSKISSKWVPTKGYYLILSVVKDCKTVILQTPEGKILQKKQPFDRIRKYRGR